MYRYILNEYVGAGNAFYIASTFADAMAIIPPHVHDHYEIVWGESGQGVHLVNGQKRPMRAGAIAFVRPDDAHILHCRARNPLRFGHLSFPVRTITKLQHRYPGQWLDPFARRTIGEREFSLRGATWSQFRWIVRELRAGARTESALDWFLLSLAQFIRPMVKQTLAPRRPIWLERIYQRLGNPEVLQGGTRGLCELAGCSPQYLARAVRNHAGVTPTEFLNEARLDYAAQKLVQTDETILNIAGDCGLNNLGHFYGLFHRKFGTTPRRYRLRHGTPEKAKSVRASSRRKE